MSLLGYAARALAMGMWIFPVNPCGTEDPENPGEYIDKWPHLIRPGRPWKIKWGEAATNDMNKVIQWWQYSPEANIGVAVRQSGLLVVDCDKAKDGTAEDGVDQYMEICAKYGMDPAQVCDTYTVRTGSGGTHFYYRWPDGVQASQAGLAPLVDVRSNGGTRGGYVLAAGSVTTKGAYTVDYDAPILDCPPVLVELCRDKPKPKPPKAMFSQPGHAGYSGLVESVRLAQEGNRNNCLLWAARSMCEDGAPEEQCIDLLVPAAMECGLDGGERQALATIRSAYRLQGSKA